MADRLRARWDFDNLPLQCGISSGIDDNQSQLATLTAIEQLLQNNGLWSHFQPIYSAKDASVFGFEALARLKNPARFPDPCHLFKAAQATGSLALLDLHCMETALRSLDTRRFVPEKWHLFLNVCPETLINPEQLLQRLMPIVETLGIPPGRIIFEITEEGVISNYDQFRSSLSRIRTQGFKFAIDDFGAGYAGLKMLSTIEPDILKIDRHFIANIDRALVNYNMVDAIVTACHRIGILVVAEGIEREEELAVLHGLGIELLQGFLLGKPTAELTTAPAGELLDYFALEVESPYSGDRSLIGDIATPIVPISHDDQIITALQRFQTTPDLRMLPVVNKDKVVGMLNRPRFLEEHIIGSHGYGYSINFQKTIDLVMERSFITFEANNSFEDVSRKITAKAGKFQNDNLVVLKNGHYLGIVETGLLLEALTERNVLLAMDSNPLSGLPGNNSLQREISQRLAQNQHFDVLYVDIDHFKPYNDHYSFERGDTVIRTLAEIIRESLATHLNPFNFAGHIGGDDFIIITRPNIGIFIAESLINAFNRRLAEFHGADDHTANGYTGYNRRGDVEQLSLLSLSIGIVSTEVNMIASYPQLASIACEVKKAAKMQPGSSIARDQRKLS